MLNHHDLTAADPQRQVLLPRPAAPSDEQRQAVNEIISAVRARGDEAIEHYGKKFDGAVARPLLVEPPMMQAALERTPKPLVGSLRTAAKAIEEFHAGAPTQQRQHAHHGITVTSRLQPADSAGCYVPGGRASYPSSLLMTAILARVAGVEDVVVCVPPGPDGKVATVTLAAAAVAKIDRLYAVGGAQAIAALTYGTETVRPVDVIVGPGNNYVALAKQAVAGTVKVPAGFAGPSEICIIADATADPRYVAIDLMVQAEHGPDGQAWLIATEASVIEGVERCLNELLASVQRRSDIVSTLENSGHAALVPDTGAAVALANSIAPEHLQIMTIDAQSLAAQVRHAGAVFVGPMSPASLGDYIAGPSHVLPTDRTARFAGPLGVADFCKTVHVIHADADAMNWAGPHVETLARAEGLHVHAESVRLRLDDLANQTVSKSGDRQ